MQLRPIRFTGGCFSKDAESLSRFFAAPMGAGLPRGVDLLMGSGYSNIHS